VKLRWSDGHSRHVWIWCQRLFHTSSLVELSSDLPVLIEVVDDEAHVDRLLPILGEMVSGGALVTVERVRVVK
jgi:hypothetical protein